VNAAPAPSAVQVRIEGRVQGVAFREACVAQAHALGVAGWVRNRDDGTVEARLQGPPDAVQRLLGWLHRGPPLARVDRVDVTPCGAEPLRGFERRPSV
jgi:acylphosphatase